MTEVIQEIIDRLEQNTPESICELFMAEGIKGDKRNAYGCPLANYVKRETGYEYTGVTHTHIRGSRTMAVSPTRVRFVMGGNVARFVENFDRGWFPSLEANRDS